MSSLTKKLLLFIILYLSFVIYPCSVESAWYKYDANPIISPSVSGWDSHSIRSPAVLNDNGQLKLYFQGSNDGLIWQIGLAKSSDLINWTKELNPVLTPSSSPLVNENGIEEPAILKDSLYRMWYKSDPTSSIRYAYSSNGIDWTKLDQPVLKGTSYWESLGVANPSVVFFDNKYYMYYTAWGQDNGWLMGLATSTDGINWTKYASNPLTIPFIGHIGRPAAIVFENKVHLFFHTGSGIGTDIYHIISTDGIHFSCDGDCSVLSRGPSSSFDSNIIIGPSVFEINGQLYLFYAGTNDDIHWSIDLASDKPIQPLVSKKTTILIPGLFGSWNKEAILHNALINQSEWQMTPFVHDYDAIKQSFTNLGYIENQDFFVFNYDWRKGLNDLADDLNNYIQQLTINNPKITIVGHSFGGLVGRIYLQKYNPTKVEKLITVGSPHLGVPQPYKVVEAGELDNDNTLIWLAQKIILQINKTCLKTDKQIIAEKFPVALDLLSIYPFLKNKNDQQIPINNMKIKNNTLLSYSPNFLDIPNLPNLTSIYGEKGNTLYGFKVGLRNIFDQLLDFYPDGRPTENISSAGDYIVNSYSASAGANPIKLENFDHGEIIYKKAGIKKILDNLNISYQDNQLVEGTGTNLQPSLIFTILSPANMSVGFNGETFQEQEGIIFIENAASGNYTLNITGNAVGRYSVLIGQMSDNQSSWSKIEGEIKVLPQQDHYQIAFPALNSQSPVISVNQLFDELIIYLEDLNKNIKNLHITKAIANLRQGKNLFIRNNFGLLKLTLLFVHQQLFLSYSKVNIEDKSKVFYSIEKLENLYGKSLIKYNHGFFPSLLKISLGLKKKIVPVIQKLLLAQKNKGKNVTDDSLILLKIDEKLKLAEENIKNKNYSFAEILLQTCEKLLKEVRKT